MNYHLAVAEVEQEHWVAWVLELQGCFGSGPTQEAAVSLAPTRVSAHFAWLARHGRRSALANESVEVQVVEVFRSPQSMGEDRVGAFFEDDRRSLDGRDVDEGLWLLSRTRRDLMSVVEQVPREKLHGPIPGEVQGSVAGVLDHVAWAEWWYFTRLGQAFDRDEMPEDPLVKLEKVRQQTVALLPGLVGDTRVAERRGEKWSARKVLRRTLWHERDHTQHIAKLLGQ
ncbi:MAG: DinB family protein [Chloroflexi bacterium]|nr:DinB family protein [Chloroflexota bacterium]